MVAAAAMRVVGTKMRIPGHFCFDFSLFFFFRNTKSTSAARGVITSHTVATGSTSRYTLCAAEILSARRSMFGRCDESDK